MATITPVQLFPGITLTGSAGNEVIGIPLSLFPSLSAVEADPTTGDGAELSFALSDQMFKAVQGLDTASRPTQATFQRTATNQVSTDLSVQVTRYTYTNAYDRKMSITTSEMEAEV